MSEYTPITGELRNFMTYDITTAPDGVSTASLDTSVFCDLCDAIDSVHAALEAENESLKAELDRERGEWDFWESTHVELPKDADGEYIHVGDVMENVVCPPVHREVTGVGVECFYGWDEGNGRYSQFSANCYRHHHTPTVEDVLRENAARKAENERLREQADKQTVGELFVRVHLDYSDMAQQLELAAQAVRNIGGGAE